jgi:hypothetical protein
MSHSYVAEHYYSLEFELAAGAVRQIAFQTALEGTAIKFLALEALQTSNTSVHTEVSYGTSDAEASDPGNGTAWRAVNGLLISWESITLSAAGKLHVYNSGSNRATVTLKVGLDGA